MSDDKRSAPDEERREERPARPEELESQAKQKGPQQVPTSQREGDEEPRGAKA